MPEIPEDVQLRLRHWRLLRALWRGAHYGLGIVAILTSAAVAAKLKNVFDAQNQHSDFFAILSLVAAVCAGLITFLHPLKKVQAYAEAWRILSDAVGRFKNQGDVPVKKLF